MKSIIIILTLGFLALADSPKLKEVLPLFQTKCAVCHKGPFLDFSTYPFVSDIFTTEELMTEVRWRVLGMKNIMPPVNEPPLSQAEKDMIVNWINQNMPE